MATKNQVVVYSKPGCCLCDRVKNQLRRLHEEAAFEWEEVNILEHSAFYERFKDVIPVVIVNNQEVFQGRLDEKRFLKLLVS